MIIDVHINYPLIVSSPQPPPPQPPTPPGCGIGAPPRTSTPRRLITPLGLQSFASAATLPSRPMPWTPGSRGAEAERPGFEVPFLVGFEGWYLWYQWHPSCMYDLWSMISMIEDKWYINQPIGYIYIYDILIQSINSVYLSIYPSVYLYVYLYVYLSIIIYLSVCPSVCRPSVRASIHPSIHALMIYDIHDIWYPWYMISMINGIHDICMILCLANMLLYF